MTRGKHTPAPWFITRGSASTNLTYVGEIYESDEKDYRGQICRLQSCENIDGISVEETKANACLIASAPDLYEALENLLNGIDTAAITSDHDETFANAIQQAREAVKKAEGK